MKKLFRRLNLFGRINKLEEQANNNFSMFASTLRQNTLLFSNAIKLLNEKPEKTIALSATASLNDIYRPVKDVTEFMKRYNELESEVKELRDIVEQMKKKTKNLPG